MKQIESIVCACVQNGFVTQENAQWLRYALEKRIISLVAFILLAGIGIMIADLGTVFAFLGSFYYLRTRTNGFHAKSVGKCLLYSALGEVVFLKVLPTVWNDIIAFSALIVSIALIWFFAPYNHPGMDLTPEEVAACANSAKWRLAMLVLALPILHFIQQEHLVKGILLGIVMTASTLITAYCLH